ncbi:MAG TPA: hypothetical protein VG206_27880 [Terriglobia bacterium]|nr:hypothetical protein [Terriglobia bacterium]
MRKLENLFALYELGSRFGSLRALLKSKEDMDSEIGISAFECIQGLKYLFSDSVLPLERSKESAAKLLGSINAMMSGDSIGKKQEYGEFLNPYFTGPIKNDIDTFQIALSEELKLLPLFSVERTGNLSIDRLVEGASDGYPSSTVALLDDFTKQEINSAGRCLAFAVPTASGFHILRAVEVGLKGYVLAATGTLPKVGNRSWGTYITEMTIAGASSDLIDLLKILKTKRNPLMHPKDTLEMSEAIGIFCICQSTIETLIEDVRHKGLDLKFSNALAALPKEP